MHPLICLKTNRETHFLVLTHFIIFYALEVICSYWFSAPETEHTYVRATGNCSQLHVQCHHVGSVKLAFVGNWFMSLHMVLLNIQT